MNCLSSTEITQVTETPVFTKPQTTASLETTDLTVPTAATPTTPFIGTPDYGGETMNRRYVITFITT